MFIIGGQSGLGVHGECQFYLSSAVEDSWRQLLCSTDTKGAFPSGIV